MTDPLGQSQALPYIIGLTKKGYSFTLVSCEKEERFESNKNIITAICESNKIDWQPIFYTKRPPILSTVWDIYKLNKKVKQLHKEKQFSLIHCRSYITALVGLGFKQKYNVPFLFDMRGFWADERVDGNIWDKSKFPFSIVYNYFKRKETQFINDADAVVSLTHEGKREILSWKKTSINTNKITVIPTCADLSLFDYNTIPSEEQKETKANLKLKETDFILTYLGSLGTWYLVEEMVDFFTTLKKIKPTAKFVIYTADDFEIVTKIIAYKKLDINDFRFKKLNRKAVPVHLSIADLSVSFIQPSFSKKASSPTKMGEILGMGIPMICNGNVGDVASIINENNCGYIIHDFSEESYTKAINQLEKEKLDKTKLRSAAKAIFSLEKGILSFEKVYKNILNGK